jgi:hypothetical protein
MKDRQEREKQGLKNKHKDESDDKINRAKICKAGKETKEKEMKAKMKDERKRK